MVEPEGANEHDILHLQRQLLTTNSILMHHDAITGTHTWQVGIDYEDLMQVSQIQALNPSFGGILSKAVKDVALAEGLKLTQRIENCIFEGLVLLCPKISKSTGLNKFSISFYNPGLQTQKGFLLYIPQIKVKFDVKIAKDSKLETVQTETYCSAKVKLTGGAFEEEPIDQVCHVYIDTEVEPLAFTHLVIQLYDGVYNKSILKPRTVFRYDPINYHLKLLNDDDKTDGMSLVMKNGAELKIDG